MPCQLTAQPLSGQVSDIRQRSSDYQLGAKAWQKSAEFVSSNAVTFHQARVFGHPVHSTPTILLPRATKDGCNFLCVQYRTVPSAAETYFYKNGRMNGFLHTRGIQAHRYVWRTRFARKTYRQHSSNTNAEPAHFTCSRRAVKSNENRLLEFMIKLIRALEYEVQLLTRKADRVI